MSLKIKELQGYLLSNESGDISDHYARSLEDFDNLLLLQDVARKKRDRQYFNVITYSKKVFIPVTKLCRNVCHYCTYSKLPSRDEPKYLTQNEILKIANDGKRLNCKEALIVMGEKPELRFSSARKALSDMGYETSVNYVADVAKMVFEETGLLPHVNMGTMTKADLNTIRTASPSMGMMLENTSVRFSNKGMPHYGCPDKAPNVRLETLIEAGEQMIPFTTGILVGIGETRRERIDALLEIRKIHRRYGHIQEVIVQNFRAKAGTKMCRAPEPAPDELLWTVAVARIILDSEVSVQVPPNLNSSVLDKLILTGINDWGGISPLTIDHVNPESAWPELDVLSGVVESRGKKLHERLTVYPAYIEQYKDWIDSRFHASILKSVDGVGYPREGNWLTGREFYCEDEYAQIVGKNRACNNHKEVSSIIRDLEVGKSVYPNDIVRLFQARGSEFVEVCQAADSLRSELVGDTVTYVVNRNINYTNICTRKCAFCAFSKGTSKLSLRDRPYTLDYDEVARRSVEAWQKGATEVCLQGGIHPSYDGNHYVNICKAIKQAVPGIHIHAFSPLEIVQGAKSLMLSVTEYLSLLKSSGLGSLPGTAAEILDDEIRKAICADKLSSRDWLNVVQDAHSVGLKTTSTIMFGHVDNYNAWANHILEILRLQIDTGGFTEFVPLPFIADQAPMYKRGVSRRGPTLRESILMYSIARLVFREHLPNIQVSWVKMGKAGASIALQSGANDLGGTLMDESISRSAGASIGQELTITEMINITENIGRNSRQRTTLYEDVSSGTDMSLFIPVAETN